MKDGNDGSTAIATSAGATIDQERGQVPSRPLCRWALVGLLVLSALALIAGMIHFSRTPKIDFPNQERFVILIYTDAYWFHENYMRWSVVDWALTAFAAGTAVSAAIKNAYSVKQEKQDAPSKLDIALMVLAILAVLATTFDAKLHAGQLALQYRKGDLILQDAKMHFENNPNDPTAKQALLDEWQRAQDVLESPLASEKSSRPATPVGPSNKDLKTFQDQSGDGSPSAAPLHR